MRFRLLWLALLALFAAPLLAQQGEEMPGGSHEQFASAALYRRLAAVGLDATRVYRIRDAHLDREDLHLSLNQGVIAFTQTVNGRITGAFFAGNGDVLLSPPDRVERWSLAQFTGAAILEEEFSSAYLRFNDDTFAELEPALAPFAAAPSADADADPGEPAEPLPATAQEFVTRWNAVAQRLAPIAALRLLVTFGNAEIGANGRWTLAPDEPFLQLRLTGLHRGVFDIYYDAHASEQITVAQSTSAGNTGYYDVWTSFPSRSARQGVSESNATVRTQAAAEAVRDPVHITRYDIRARILPPRRLEADTTVELETSAPRERVLLFELSRFLEVQQVTLGGQPLEFVQNEALEGSELSRRGNDLIAVVLPQPLAPGRRVQVRFSYAGEVLSDAGGGLVYVGARGIWYPNRGLAMSAFDMEFHYPADWTLVATGKRLPNLPTESARRGGEGEAAPEQVAHYVSERPMPVAGFNLGRYVRAEARAGAVTVATYAAHSMESSFPRPQGVTVPGPSPYSPTRNEPGDTMMSQPPPPPAPPAPAAHAQRLANASARTIDFLASRLGPFPYSTLSLTQMPGRSSQSWPGLIYLSSLAFIAPEARPAPGPHQFDAIVYGRLMPAHETAHQYWGDLLVWKSYREQWVVEALSNYSVLLMIEEQDPAAFRAVMEQYRRDLLAARNGRTVADAGPVTLGVRLNSSHSPDAYELIAYGRGTWLFHMLRHMLLDAACPKPSASTCASATGARARPDSDLFFQVLHRLRERFEGKSITTGNVQQAFEEVLPPSLRYEGHKSLDWFFDGWVNGTAIPHLELSGVKLSRQPGATLATGRILQKQAQPDLVTSAPVYAEVGSGPPVLLGRVFVEGAETSFRFSAPAATRKLLLDPYQTVLTRP